MKIFYFLFYLNFSFNKSKIKVITYKFLFTELFFYKEAEKNINKNITNKTEEKLIDKNMKKNKINNSKDKTKERILFYGVLLSFFLFIFKTTLNIELGTFSLETFFNCLIIILIGFMLFKNQIIPKA